MCRGRCIVRCRRLPRFGRHRVGRSLWRLLLSRPCRALEVQAEEVAPRPLLHPRDWTHERVPLRGEGGGVGAKNVRDVGERPRLFGEVLFRRRSRPAPHAPISVINGERARRHRRKRGRWQLIVHRCCNELSTTRVAKFP